MVTTRSEMIECSIQHFHAHYISHEDGRGFFAQIHMAYGILSQKYCPANNISPNAEQILDFCSGAGQMFCD